MTLDELDEEIKKRGVTTPAIPAYQEHQNWLKGREVEDKFIGQMKCSYCKSDLKLNVLGGTYHYTCTVNPSHHYLRYTPIKSLIDGSVRDYDGVD